MDNKELYESFNWDNLKKEHLEGKILKILETIPHDVNTIIDVGCGNGIITNELGKKYDITAVDRSAAALKFVKTKIINASSNNIPVKDNSFDMVFSSEMLEHLPHDILTDTISEFKRISKKYIFITVPNDENPNKLSIKCPKCEYLYNSPNHLSSFNAVKIKTLFPKHDLIKSFAYGNLVRYYNDNLLKLKIKLTPSDAWIPYYWMPKSKRNTFCPNCEHVFYNKYKFNPIATSIDIINVIVSPKKPSWLFVLLRAK